MSLCSAPSSIVVTHQVQIYKGDMFEMYYGFYNNKQVFCNYRVSAFGFSEDPANTYVTLIPTSINCDVNNSLSLYIHVQYLIGKRIYSWIGVNANDEWVAFSLEDDIEFQEVFRTAIEIGINEEIAIYEERNDLFFSLLTDCPGQEEKAEEIKKKDMRNIRRRVINKVKKHFKMKKVPFKI